MESEKTIIITTSKKGTAVSNYFYELAEAFVRNGYKSIILLGNKWKGETSEHPNLKFYTWPNKRPTKIKDILFFISLCKTYRPDIIIGNFGASNAVLIGGRIAGVKKRLEWYHTMTEQIDMDGKVGKLKTIIQRFRKKLIYNLSTHMITNSAATAKDAVKSYGIAAGHISVITFLVPDPLTEQLNKIDNEFCISFVGRLEKSKGQETLLKTLPKVLNVYPDLKIYIVGDGSDRLRLENIANEYNISKSVIFTGAIPYTDVLSVMKKSLLHISASRQEAFGLVNVESIAVGTPVIATRVGGIPEIIQHGKNGYLFNPGDTETLEKLLIKVIGNPDLIKELERNARQSFLEKFCMNEQNLDSHVKKIESL